MSTQAAKARTRAVAPLHPNARAATNTVTPEAPAATAPIPSAPATAYDQLIRSFGHWLVTTRTAGSASPRARSPIQAA